MRCPDRRLLQAAAIVVAAACGFALPPRANGDTVVMKNGDRLTGTVERLREGKLELETPYAGTIAIDTEAIESVRTDAEVTIINKDYSRVIGRIEGGGASLQVRTDGDGTVRSVPTARVSSLLPGRLTERDWRITGRVNVGVTDTGGNTDVRRLNGDAEVIARRDRNRWSLSARGNEATERSTDTEGNARAGVQYDRFSDEVTYAYGNSTLEYDRFKDLRLRATVGAGVGLQVIDRASTHLALEGGVERVREDYFNGADQRFWATRLVARFDHWLWPDTVQLFHVDQSYIALSDIGNTFVRTQTGLRFPLRMGFVSTLQFNVDWDGAPSPGRKAVDRQLVFSLGYRW